VFSVSGPIIANFSLFIFSQFQNKINYFLYNIPCLTMGWVVMNIQIRLPVNFYDVKILLGDVF
jgi:hypothetical protein